MPNVKKTRKIIIIIKMHLVKEEALGQKYFIIDPAVKAHKQCLWKGISDTNVERKSLLNPYCCTTHLLKATNSVRKPVNIFRGEVAPLNFALRLSGFNWGGGSDPPEPPCISHTGLNVQFVV